MGKVKSILGVFFIIALFQNSLLANDQLTLKVRTLDSYYKEGIEEGENSIGDFVGQFLQIHEGKEYNLLEFVVAFDLLIDAMGDLWLRNSPSGDSALPGPLGLYFNQPDILVCYSLGGALIEFIEPESYEISKEELNLALLETYSEYLVIRLQEGSPFRVRSKELLIEDMLKISDDKLYHEQFIPHLLQIADDELAPSQVVQFYQQKVKEFKAFLAKPGNPHGDMLYSSMDALILPHFMSSLLKGSEYTRLALRYVTVNKILNSQK